MFDFISKIFRKKNSENNLSRKTNGKRILELEEGDSCLILKENGKSLLIDSGNEQLTKADEIVCMMWCYIANPEFVKLLETMFSDIVDEVNADKMRDNMSIGRMGTYSDGGNENELKK